MDFVLYLDLASVFDSKGNKSLQFTVLICKCDRTNPREDDIYAQCLLKALFSHTASNIPCL